MGKQFAARCRVYGLWLVLAACFCLLYLGSLQYTMSPDPSWTRQSPKPCGASCSVDESKHFLLHTPACVVPDIPPNHPSVGKYRGKPRELSCSKNRPLTTTEDLTLLLHPSHVEDYGLTSPSTLRCWYQAITRVEQTLEHNNGNCDKKFNLGPPTPLDYNSTRMGDDGVLVTCSDTAQPNATIYQQVHYFIQPRRAGAKRKVFKERQESLGAEPEHLSIVIMGTDALSRGNLIRHLPNTFQYLRQQPNALDFQGFVKVGDNTDPNLRAVLMGVNKTEFQNHPCRHKKKAYDWCPFLWQNFSQAGYVTAWGEDAPWMGVFHYNQRGFVKEPTDYYNRPFFQASEKYTSHNGDHGGSNGRLCQGLKPSMRVIHDYSLNVARALNDIPYFGFYWSASITHDYLKSAAMADTPLLEYLKAMEPYMNHTVILFISDHGLRWGSFRSTYAGMLEERMPYVYAIFPPWFKNRYPNVWKNLVINTRRLTSSFDLYPTLLDIMNRAYVGLERTYQSIHGQSLFTAVPLNRTCEAAGVPDHYCPCQESVELDPTDPRLATAAVFAVDNINTMLKEFPMCVQLQLDEVNGGRILSAGNSTKPKENSSISTTVTVTFTTMPGGALLEATLKEHLGVYELTAEVSRINQYGSQSHCITHQVLRKYCLCDDMVE